MNYEWLFIGMAGFGVVASCICYLFVPALMKWGKERWIDEILFFLLVVIAAIAFSYSYIAFMGE